MTHRQRNLIIQSPIEELILATDNDLAGQRIATSIYMQLNGYVVIKNINLPEHVKDINELTQDELLGIVSVFKNSLKLI